MKKILFTLAFGAMAIVTHANTSLEESNSVSQNNTNTAELAVAAENCFDFNDSCGGSWTVCHQNVTTEQLINFLYSWDGGC